MCQEPEGSTLRSMWLRQQAEAAREDASVGGQPLAATPFCKEQAVGTVLTPNSTWPYFLGSIFHPLMQHRPLTHRPVISHCRMGGTPTCQSKEVVSRFLETLWQMEDAFISSEQNIVC